MMRNLTFDHELLKAHTPEPLEGYAVVVFERIGEAGERLHSVLHPGDRPVKPGFPLPFRRRAAYLAFAVDLSAERHLDFSERMRLADEMSEFRVVFHLAYAVSDASLLARLRNVDPLRRMSEHVRATVKRDVEQLTREEVWEAFPLQARSMVDVRIDDLREFAGLYGLALGSLRLAVHLPEASELPTSLVVQEQVISKIMRAQERIAAQLVDEWRLGQAREDGQVSTELIQARRRLTEQHIEGSYLRLNSFLEACERRQSVFLGGSALHEVQPGDTVLVQFAAYTARFKERVRQALEREAEPEEIRQGGKSNTQWAVGVRVSVHCRANGLVVPTPVQHFTWDGRWQTVSFDVEVAADAPARTTVIVLE